MIIGGRKALEKRRTQIRKFREHKHEKQPVKCIKLSFT